MTRDLAAWAEERAEGAARALRRAVSATGLEHVRPQFGWRVRPVAGSVLASPRRALWDPEPDYFHHWTRDAAIVMRGAPALAVESAAAAAFWRTAFPDWIGFELRTTDPDAPPLAGNPLRATTRPEAARFLRPDAELRALTGAARIAEPRRSPDGGPDLERWGRPQHDGPALRAAACLASRAAGPDFDPPEARRLIDRDLGFLETVAGAPCLGPWEEGPPRHDAFTLIVQWDALDRGAALAEAEGDARRAAARRAAAARARAAVAPVWDEAARCWRASAEAGPGEIDAAVALALLWAERREGPFALGGAGARGMVAALERLFADLYPINRGAPAPAIGRFASDAYFGGNPWLPTTLAVAELHYRWAAAGDGLAALARGDAFLSWVRRVSPEGDALPEQFDRETAAPAGCRDLAWSAAAFLSALDARRAAVQAVGA